MATYIPVRWRRLFSMAETAQEVGIQAISVENKDDIRSVYTNHGRISMTQWDARFMFAEIIVAETFVDGKATPTVHLESRANIVMTPAHAKAFYKALGVNLRLMRKQTVRSRSSIHLRLNKWQFLQAVRVWV